jgi:large subunit ribosomal protein L32
MEIAAITTLAAISSQPAFWRRPWSPAILNGNCRRMSAGNRTLTRWRSSIMAVPKRRMSRANTRSRRAQWKAAKPELVNVTVGGQQHKVPRRLLKAARLGLIDLDKR